MRAPRTVLLLGAFAATAANAPTAPAQEGAAACGAETIGLFPAASVIDGHTFRLTDGREVRIAGTEAPAGNAAREALEKLLAGHLILLKRMEPGRDRYGRLVAHAYALRNGTEASIAQEMIAGGHARVGVRVGDPTCAAALLAAERTARDAKLGLWADSHYAIKLADDAAALLREPGRFTLAEGKVLSVRESRGTIYVNFGRVWSRNLTVTIPKRDERLFAAAGVDPKKLAGRRLRVRGWIEDRSGPRIEAARPEQIEIVD